MRVLLDTKSWVWWLTDEPCLSDQARRAITDERNDVFVSVASIWELSLKTPRYVAFLRNDRVPLDDWAARDGFHLLQIEAAQVLSVAGRRFDGRNPFVPILIGQAATRGLVVVTDNVRPYRDARIDVIPARQWLFRARDRSGGRGGRLRSSRPTG
jgi:PIN domain nuclease of toxin-antitoxin system